MNLAEGRRLLEEATKRPWELDWQSEGDWEHGYQRYLRGIWSPKDNAWVVRFDDDYGSDQVADARLIEFAIANLPALLDLVEAAKFVAKQAPRVPDGNGFGYDWTIPNPLITILKELENGKA